MGDAFKIEIERNLTKFVLIGVLIFYLFGLAIVQVGIIKCKSQIKKHEEFVELEQKKVQRYINVKQFGWAGIRRALESSPISAMFFNSTPLDSLVSFCDVGFRLELSKTEIGNGLFEDTHKGSLDYSWYILTIGGVFVSAWGFFSFRNREYIKYLMNFTSLKNIHIGILLARIFLVFICQLIFLFLSWFQFLINGIFLEPHELLSMLIFLMVSTLVLFFILVLSSAFGSVKNVIVGGIITGVVFFILILLWPEIINVFFSRLASTDIKSFYAHEVKKVDKLMKFEKEIYTKIGTGRYTKQQMIDIEKQAGEDWYTNEYSDLEKQENEMIAKTDEIIKQFHFISIINPATFYKSVNSELSSKGFNAYRMFYRSIIEGQKKFLRYYLDERWKENYKPQIEHIFKDKEIVVKFKSSLPYFFTLGLILLILYIFGALLLSFSRFKKYLFPDMIVKNTKKLEMQFSKGEDIQITCKKEPKEWLLNVLNGKVDKLDGKVEIDGKSIISKDKKDYFYFPDLEELPGHISCRSMASIAKIPKTQSRKRLKQLDFIEKFKLVIQIAKNTKREIYLFNLAWPIDLYEVLEKVKEDLKAFKNEETVVIYLGSVTDYAPLGILRADKEKMMIIKRDGEIVYRNFFSHE